jgi:hypothetical protein
MSLPQMLSSGSRSSHLRIGDLYSLLDPDVQDPAGHVQKIFDWFDERGMNIVRLAFGAAGALLIALITALLQNKPGPTPLEGAAIAASVVAFVAIGGYRLIRVNVVHREYLATIGVLMSLRRLWNLLNP